MMESRLKMEGSRPTLIGQRVRQLLAGKPGLSEDAFTRLYQSQLRRVLNYVRYRLGPEDAEDVTADIFARIWARRHNYDPRKGAPTTWLWAIARNAVTDRLRRQGPVLVELSPDLAEASDPLAHIEWEEEWQQMRAALAHLPTVDQEIIALRFGAGHTNRNIAALVEMSEANVAQRLRRALRKMGIYLRGEDSP
jgi:RNA polymerase sigma-70 factor (ECF subfamily)